MIDFIINEKAGNRRTARTKKTIAEILDAKNIDYRFHHTAKPKHAIEITKELCKNGATDIVAVGELAEQFGAEYIREYPVFCFAAAGHKQRKCECEQESEYFSAHFKPPLSWYYNYSTLFVICQVVFQYSRAFRKKDCRKFSAVEKPVNSQTS